VDSTQNSAASLRRLFELRNAADYSWLDAPSPEADDPIGAAKRFVEGVERWIADSQG